MASQSGTVWHCSASTLQPTCRPCLQLQPVVPLRPSSTGAGSSMYAHTVTHYQRPQYLNTCPQELLHALRTTTPRILLIDPPTCKDLHARNALSQLLNVPWTMAVAYLGSSTTPQTSWDTAVQHPTNTPIHVIPSMDAISVGSPVTLPTLHAPADNAAVIVFTSGTTGHSKAVLLSHHNLMFQSIAKIVRLYFSCYAIMCICVFVNSPPPRNVLGIAETTSTYTLPRCFTWEGCPQHWPCCRQERYKSSPLVFFPR